jgi:hypothetical protein
MSRANALGWKADENSGAANLSLSSSAAMLLGVCSNVLARVLLDTRTLVVGVENTRLPVTYLFQISLRRRSPIQLTGRLRSFTRESRHSTSYRRSEVSAAVPSDTLSISSSGVWFDRQAGIMVSAIFIQPYLIFLPAVLIITCMHVLYLFPPIHASFSRLQSYY